MKIEFTNGKWAIFFWINLLWILGTIALGYIAYTSTPPEQSNSLIETIKIVFLSLGGLGIILPTYLNVFNALEQMITQKTENTFRMLEKWDDPLLFKARKFTRDLKTQKPTLSDQDLIQKINNDEKLKQSVILVMNYFERIRISINAGRVDITTLKDTIGSLFEDIHRRLLPYAESLGEKNKTDWDEILNLLKVS
mgnify:CR=1 FL=1|jgi:hypothetical protein